MKPTMVLLEEADGPHQDQPVMRSNIVSGKYGGPLKPRVEILEYRCAALPESLLEDPVSALCLSSGVWRTIFRRESVRDGTTMLQ